MTPNLPPIMGPIDPTRSRIMSAIRGKHTVPERALRSALHAAGARFRIHAADVPGRPDISHRGACVAVFVDGCFWHGCPRHYARPATRADYWKAKLAGNQERRQRVLGQLAEGGWKVFEFWECEVGANAPRIAVQVASAIASRRSR